jgi:hypothetical protein
MFAAAKERLQRSPAWGTLGRMASFLTADPDASAQDAQANSQETKGSGLTRGDAAWMAAVAACMAVAGGILVADMRKTLAPTRPRLPLYWQFIARDAHAGETLAQLAAYAHADPAAYMELGEACDSIAAIWSALQDPATQHRHSWSFYSFRCMRHVRKMLGQLSRSLALRARRRQAKYAALAGKAAATATAAAKTLSCASGPAHGEGATADHGDGLPNAQAAAPKYGASSAANGASSATDGASSDAKRGHASGRDSGGICEPPVGSAEAADDEQIEQEDRRNRHVAARLARALAEADRLANRHRDELLGDCLVGYALSRDYNWERYVSLGMALRSAMQSYQDSISAAIMVRPIGSAIGAYDDDHRPDGGTNAYPHSWSGQDEYDIHCGYRSGGEQDRDGAGPYGDEEAGHRGHPWQQGGRAGRGTRRHYGAPQSAASRTAPTHQGLRWGSQYHDEWPDHRRVHFATPPRSKTRHSARGRQAAAGTRSPSRWHEDEDGGEAAHQLPRPHRGQGTPSARISPPAAAAFGADPWHADTPARRA